MGITPAKLLSSMSSFLAPSDKKEFRSKYTLGKTIGCGSYGQIKEATQTSTFRTVAVKFVKRKNVETLLKVHKQCIPAEAVFLSSLHHPNIISLIDLYEFRSKFALVLERPLASLDLHEFISKFGPQNDSVASYMAGQLLATCRHLDTHLIFHRDVKSENILVNYYDYSLKLIDFGSATYDNQETYYGNYGTPAFSPPEWVADRGYRPEPTTMWSCGVVLWEVLTGTLPFHDEEQVLRAALPFPDHLNYSARDLLRKILRAAPEDRAGFEEALEHPYVTLTSGCLGNQRVLDDSNYSKCSAFTIFENHNCSSDLPMSLI